MEGPVPNVIQLFLHEMRTSVATALRPRCAGASNPVIQSVLCVIPLWGVLHYPAPQSTTFFFFVRQTLVSTCFHKNCLLHMAAIAPGFKRVDTFWGGGVG